MPRFGKERLRLEPAKGVLCRWKRQERKRTLALLRSRLSKKSTACVDGGASSPARCRGSNFQFEPWQFCLQGKNAESCGFCASCHPLQFPLKSYGFPGAETARKRFLLWEMGFPDAKISTRADVHAAGLDFYARGLRPSRALLGVDRRDVFSGDDFCGGALPARIFFGIWTA